MKLFKALIGSVDANPLSSCACLYVGPCNRGGHFMTSEQAQGNADSGKVFCIFSLQNCILTSLKLEQLTWAGHGASERCPQVVLSVTGGRV